MTHVNLETERMVLRPFRETDAEAAHHWFSDAEVMRFIPSAPDASVAETKARLGRYMEHQARYGFSKWLVMDRASSVPMGDAGLIHLPDGQRVELGYRFARSWWGKGLATEVGAAWVKAAREWFGIETLYAFAHGDNEASLHVIEKLGFKRCGKETFYGMDAPLYVMSLVVKKS